MGRRPGTPLAHLSPGARGGYEGPDADVIQNTTTSSSSASAATAPEVGVGHRDQVDVLLDRDGGQLVGRHAGLEHHDLVPGVPQQPRAGLDVSAVQEANGDADMAGE